MSTLQEFDILFRNFFDQGTFLPTTHYTKLPHPLDIYSTPEGVFFEVACTGLEKTDIEVFIQGDILRIKYDKPEIDENQDREYIKKGIAKRSFDLGYKISNKLNTSKTEVKMKNGLLKIHIPYSEEAQLKVLEIK